MITRPVLYDEEFVRNEVNGLLKDLRSNGEVVFIGELIESRPYSRQRLSEWNKQFGGEISDTTDKIKEILETRAITGALKNKLNASITKFHLINNYDWKDKNVTDMTSGNERMNLGVIMLPARDILQ